MFEDQRLPGLFRREIGDRDLRKPAFLGSKAGPEGCVDNTGDGVRIRSRRQLGFAFLQCFLKMTFEVLFDNRGGRVGGVVWWIFFNGSLPVEQRLLIYEAETVAPRIVRVEGPFTPRTHDDVARRLAVNVFRRETIQFARTRLHRVDIVHGEINVVGKWFRFSLDSVVSRDVDERPYHGPASEIMTRPARHAPATIAEQLAVKVFGAVEIVDLENDSVECWGHRMVPFG
jgi:hypothetical protein